MPLPSLGDDSGRFLDALDALRPRGEAGGRGKRVLRLNLTPRRLALLVGVVMAMAVLWWALAGRRGGTAEDATTVAGAVLVGEPELTTPPGTRVPPLEPASTARSFPGLELVLRARPPASGQPRTVELSLTAELGDGRVLRSVRFELGNGAALERSLPSTGCGNPTEPNPPVVAGPTYTYGAAGTYPVTAAVRTAPCAPGGSTVAGAEESARIRIDLVVP